MFGGIIMSYLRDIDSRFTINDVSMPKPHGVVVKRKWNNLDADRDINTGAMILNPVNRIYEVTWKYKLLRSDQYDIIMGQVFQASKSNYNNKEFKTYDPNRGTSISFTTYEPDDFTPPDVAFIRDGYKYFDTFELHFTSIAGVTEA